MNRARLIAAWGVHLFTASGAVVSVLAIAAIGRGEWRMALAWMAAAMVIDSFDGMLARAVRVRQVIPGVDGALLDNMVDYLGYVVAPAYLVLEAPLVPEGTELAAAAAILLSSGYQFAQIEAKTDDFFFKGFPSFWNVAVLYLLLGGLPPTLNLGILLALAVGVFVPLHWAYPSRMTRLRGTMITLTMLWGLSVAGLLVVWPPPGSTGVVVSFLYVPVYMLVSLALAPPRRRVVGVDRAAR